VEVEPSTREEYKSFLTSCMVPADTTLTGRWVEGATRPILHSYYYARCLDFDGRLMPCIREPQDVVYRGGPEYDDEYDDYTGGPVFTSINSIAIRRRTVPSGDATTVQLSRLDIEPSSKLSDRALAYIYYTRFKPRWDVLRRYATLREHLEALLGGPMHMWFSVYHAIMVELEACGIMTTQGRRIVSPYAWENIIDPDHPGEAGRGWHPNDWEFQDYIIYCEGKTFVFPQMSDAVYMFMMHGPVFEAAWKLKYHPTYMHHGRFMLDGPDLRGLDGNHRMAVMRDMRAIWPFYDEHRWPEG
jgi:hypothetical protein